jgi:hypothetical protein
VGPSAGLDRCGKSRPPTGIRYPDRPSRSESLYRLNASAVLDSWPVRLQTQPGSSGKNKLLLLYRVFHKLPGAPFLEGKRPEREIHHLTPPRVEAKNKWKYA